MSGPQRLAGWLTASTGAVLIAALLLTAVFGVGVTHLEADSSLEQFESESAEREALTAADERFSTDDGDDETTVQLAVRGAEADVLSRESLLATLELQAAIREDERVAPTLVEESPTVGFETVVATSIVHRDEIESLERRADDLERREQRLNTTAGELRTGLEEIRDQQRAYDELNDSSEAGEISEAEYRNRSDGIEAEIDDIVETTTADLDVNDTAAFERAVRSVRSTQHALHTLERDRFDSEAAYQRHRDRLEDDLSAAYTDGTVGVLSDEYERLRADRDRLVADRRALESSGEPPLSAQVDALESANESTYEETIDGLLEGDGFFSDLAGEFLPTDHEPGSDTVETRLLVVTQELDPEGAETGLDAIEDRHVDSQRAIAELADDHAADSEHAFAVFGFGLFSDEIDQSLADSLVIVGPIAVAFVVLALAVAYRDPLDIALGIVGILIVLIWTVGFMGWAGIAVNQALVTVPVLLVGLSIDYAVHVIMRHREARDRDRTAASEGEAAGNGGGGTVGIGAQEGFKAEIRGSMTVALAGLGIAFTWVTVTTSIGFLSNLVSPIGPIREFGLVSTVGILAAFVIFGAVVPAAKIELDSRLERRGIDRRKRAFGTGPRLGAALSTGARVARAAPVVVLVCALALTVAGAYGATTVDTSLEQEDLLVEEPPDWTGHLPEQVAPGEYRANGDLTYIDRHFQRETPRTQVIVDGDVTDPETIRRLAAAQDEAAEMDSIRTGSADDPVVRSPLTVMETVAAENDSFNASFQVADETGDGIPDRNVELLYDRLFEVDPDAAGAVISRTESAAGREYESVRLLVDIRGDADGERVTAETRALAETLESAEGEREGGWTGTADPQVTATATGDPIVTHVLERDVLTAMLESLALTLVVVALVLAVAYRLSGAGAAFGVVTVLPVCLTVPWILGTMAVLDVPLNALTGTIASLTVGLGVAYSIHVSSRYRLELGRGVPAREALTTTVRATGGALLGSAATTVGGVATLLFAIVPVLRQFGVITALMIAYAFVVSVVVLPSLLVLWTRAFGSSTATEASSRDGRLETETGSSELSFDEANGSEELADEGAAVAGPGDDTGGTDGRGNDAGGTDGRSDGAGGTDNRSDGAGGTDNRSDGAGGTDNRSDGAAATDGSSDDATAERH